MPTINKNSTRNKPVQWSTDNSAKYYGSKAWKDLRNAYITQHPLCENCLLEGRSTAAEEVHHKKPFLTGITDDDKWLLLLDYSNLTSLCKVCHKKIHNQMRQYSK